MGLDDAPEDTFYVEERKKLARARERMLKSYPLMEVMSQFMQDATQLNLRYQEYIDAPNRNHTRIMTILLARIEENFLKICEANLIERAEE